MRDRLIYILKHNAAIQKLYRVVMSFVFRALGVFIKTDDSLVLFVSFMGMGFNDSPKAIYDFMQANETYRSYRCVWAFEHPERYPSLETVKIDSPAYFKTALKAKYWVTNTNIERGLKFKKKSQVYLNTWHGIALKHIGNDCPGRKDYNFDTVDALVVSGKHDERVWKSAFHADEKTYLRCGMPRNEALWLSEDVQKQQMREKLGLPADKKVILYAPTWRDSTDGGKSYTIKPPIHFDLWEKELGADYIVLFRAHHQTTAVLGVQFNDFVRDVSDYPAVNDLMIASDLLITDYSAIAFDYSILCRPIFCYAYDYETYLAERGTYFDIDERYPNKSCRTENELLGRIKGIDYRVECENTKRFRDAFVTYGIGATEACVNALIGETKQ
ncbi:MAG: CDP-glycerol glycerophosphotransferase family protein [Oscillospiraceae bacterium]|nr:CDP-glycerol glycerophosphotransferase family protein [Oscillospiraceae bacterium]